MLALLATATINGYAPHAARLTRSRLTRSLVYRTPNPSLAESDSPLYEDNLWLRTEKVQFGGDGGGDESGVGRCVTFAAGSEDGDSAGSSRAILLLDTSAGSAGERPQHWVEVPRARGPVQVPVPTGDQPNLTAGSHLAALCSLADRLAFSCECTVLLPSLAGGAARWPRPRLGLESLRALTWLNQVKHIESVAIIGAGDTAGAAIELLAEGALEAHAAVALCPRAGSADALGRAARELTVPLLGICAGGPDTEPAASLRRGLGSNSRLGNRFYVGQFGNASFDDFVLRPARTEADTKEADRAIALVQSWIDKHVTA
jgi:hypothetical protein